MSLQNVEIIRSAFEEWRETGRIALRYLDREVEWHTRADLPDSGVYRGHDGVAALLKEWGASFDDPRFEVEDYLDRGDRVVVPLVLSGRIRGSEQEVAMPETWGYKLREGIVVEVREYRTIDEALEAMALEG